MLSLLAFIAISIPWTACHEHSEHDAPRIHECANHKRDIIKGVNLHQIHVPYKNHPYDTTISPEDEQQPSTRRRGLTESQTAPIRVSAYYDPVSVTNARSAAEIHALKAVIGAIVNYYENTVRVIPVDGTFYMKRWCSYFYYSDYGSNCIQYNGGSSINTCQDATVPTS